MLDREPLGKWNTRRDYHVFFLVRTPEVLENCFELWTLTRTVLRRSSGFPGLSTNSRSLATTLGFTTPRTVKTMRYRSLYFTITRCTQAKSVAVYRRRPDRDDELSNCRLQTFPVSSGGNRSGVLQPRMSLFGAPTGNNSAGRGSWCTAAVYGQIYAS